MKIYNNIYMYNGLRLSRRVVVVVRSVLKSGVNVEGGAGGLGIPTSGET